MLDFLPGEESMGGTSGGGGFLNFLQNPWVQAALTGYLTAVSGPRLAGTGRNLARGGVAALGTLMEAPYLQAQQKKLGMEAELNAMKMKQARALQDAIATEKDPDKQRLMMLDQKGYVRGEMAANRATVTSQAYAGFARRMADAQSDPTRKEMLTAVADTIDQNPTIDAQKLLNIARTGSLDEFNQTMKQLSFGQGEARLEESKRRGDVAVSQMDLARQREQRQQEEFEWKKKHPSASPLSQWPDIGKWQADRGNELRKGYHKSVADAMKGVSDIDAITRAAEEVDPHDPKNGPTQVAQLLTEYIRVSNSYASSLGKARMTVAEQELYRNAISGPDRFRQWFNRFRTGSPLYFSTIDNIKKQMRLLNKISKDEAYEKVQAAKETTLNEAASLGLPEDFTKGFVLGEKRNKEEQPGPFPDTAIDPSQGAGTKQKSTTKSQTPAYRYRIKTGPHAGEVFDQLETIREAQQKGWLNPSDDVEVIE